ncbi:MAG: class I SAM-dependent methyltransferase [Chloroflexi bacterium]|nr:class I SAM-dependent methyltransferase [Chloroflexota bacterium]
MSDGRPARGTGPDARPLPPTLALQRSLQRYRRLSPGIRAFVRARLLLAPLAEILGRLPSGGRILDVGCGHGLFANALALGSPTRVVVGVDPAPAKIVVAIASAEGLPNVRFVRGTVEDLDERDFDAIVILDVLYLLRVERKLAVLRACRERLATGGVLVLKTNDTRPRWKYRVAYLQERLMTGLGLTRGQGLYFLSREQNAALLELAGFQPKTVVLRSRLPYPHVLFLARPA